MTGLANVFDGIKHKIAQLLGLMGHDLTEAEQWAVKTLAPSIHALAAFAETQGIQLAEKAAAAAIEAATTNIAAGGSVAGQAALAAGLAIVKTEAPDALHALSTAAVTAAKQVVDSVAANVAATPTEAPAQGVNE